MYALNCYSCNDASNTFMHAYTYGVDILFNLMVRSQYAHSLGPLFGPSSKRHSIGVSFEDRQWPVVTFLGDISLT